MRLTDPTQYGFERAALKTLVPERAEEQRKADGPQTGGERDDQVVVPPAERPEGPNEKSKVADV